MEELLEYLVRSLVDRPDEVSVESFEEDDGTLVLELHVADDDAPDRIFVAPHAGEADSYGHRAKGG